MTRNQKRIAVACGLLASLGPIDRLAAETGELLDGQVLYGISAASNQLVQYRFSDGDYKAVGPVAFEDGTELTGIEGMAYLPEHLNIFGFWTDPDSQNSRLVYISRQNGQAALVGGDFGPGQVTGAAVSGIDAASDLSQENVLVGGEVNLNPSNNDQFEFNLIASDGSKVTRDMLLAGEGIDADGNIFNGDAIMIVFKPKGNGNQNTMTVDGTPYDLKNGETYTCEADVSGPIHVRVWNDKFDSNGKAMGHWWLIFDSTDTDPVNIHEQRGIFAIQNVENVEDTTIDFDVVGGHVVPSETFAAKFTVIGAAITAGGAYDIPVTVQTNTGGVWEEPFGDFTKAVAGNVNDTNNPRRHICTGVFPAGTPLSVRATSWIKRKSYYSGTKESHWRTYLTVDSDSDSPNVLVLRNGDPVPNIDPFMNQDEILDLIRDYVDQDTDTVVLDENQAIFLFELGTTSLTSSAADFQDLVVLVTLASEPSQLNKNDDDDELGNFSSRLIKVDPVTAGYEQVMTLNNRYDSLAATTDGMFYATLGDHLYLLNPFDQTETLVGDLPTANFMGFEAAGDTFAGFTNADDTLVPIDVTTGEAIGSPLGFGANDLRTIVFAPETDPPSAFISFD